MLIGQCGLNVNDFYKDGPLSRLRPFAHSGGEIKNKGSMTASIFAGSSLWYPS
jgi:hypothetical protein